MRHMGQGMSLALGAAVVGIFLSADIYNIGGTISAAEYVQGLSRVFLIGGIIALAGVFTAIIREPGNKTDENTIGNKELSP